MRLSRIEIENFKGFATRQTIDIRPITLLFGANSTGKSTILQALQYLREILERGNVDPDKTLVSQRQDLGGFSTFVHNQELDRTVKLKLVLDISDENEIEEMPINSGLALIDIDSEEFSELQIAYIFNERQTDGKYIVQTIGMEISIDWSELKQSPYISELAIELNEISVAAIVSGPNPERAFLSKFNFQHPLLCPPVLSEDESNDYFDSTVISSPLEEEIRSLAREAAADRLLSGSLDGKTIQAKYESHGCPDLEKKTLHLFALATRKSNENLAVLEKLFAKQEEDVQEFFKTRARENLEKEDGLRITVKTDFGALPNLDESLDIDIRDPDLDIEDLETIRMKGLRSLLTEIMLGPSRIIRNFLAKMIYVGPIREIPSRNYRSQVTPDEARWAHGLAAWDFLCNDRSGQLMEGVNSWLAESHRLNTPYQIERMEYKQIPVPGAMHQIFERGINEDDIGDLQRMYNDLSTSLGITLRDYQKGILVELADVGVGISQMIPVIVATLQNQQGLVVIEQPELHIHPAIQVGLGDLFINAVFAQQKNICDSSANENVRKKDLIIETHSEHIMLRLLRRVREKNYDELPPNTCGLSPNDLSVVYIDSGEDGCRCNQLRISPDGDFVDRWPQGFFEERVEELF